MFGTSDFMVIATAGACFRSCLGAAAATRASSGVVCGERTVTLIMPSATATTNTETRTF